MENLYYIRCVSDFLEIINKIEKKSLQDGLRDFNNQKGIWLKVTDDGMESVIMSNEQKDIYND